MLLVRKVSGIRVCDLVVIAAVGWFIISLYDLDSEEWCSSLARICIKDSMAGLSFCAAKQVLA